MDNQAQAIKTESTELKIYLIVVSQCINQNGLEYPIDYNYIVVLLQMLKHVRNKL